MNVVSAGELSSSRWLAHHEAPPHLRLDALHFCQCHSRLVTLTEDGLEMASPGLALRLGWIESVAIRAWMIVQENEAIALRVQKWVNDRKSFP